MVKAAVPFWLVVFISAPVVARAQVYDSVGTRAQGMAGAFVALADDASATWWNPAGLATGAYFNGILEYGLLQQPRQERDPGGDPAAAWQSRLRSVSVAFPSLGLSYYRVLVAETRPSAPTGGASLGRQDQRTAPVQLRALVLNQFGATVGQSLGNHLVIGSTVKLVRGTVAGADVAAADASLDRAAGLQGSSETHPDLDVGVLTKFGGIQAGVAVKNIRAPSFGAGTDRQQLQRQARAGVAVTGRSRGIVDQLAIAFDADLTRTSTAVGDARYIAAGIEAWTLQRRLGLRTGLSANTVGEHRASPSAGVSVAVRSGMYAEGQGTFGPDQARKGWGFDLRVTF
jgi:F plasmid transfer operon protein TraF